MGGREGLYLISVRPKFAYRMLLGVKKYELRRWPRVVPRKGSRVVIYASGTVQSIVGEFVVGRVIEGDYESVASALRGLESGLTGEDLSYIRGARKCIAIEVLSPRPYARPLSLAELRLVAPWFRPPRSIAELDPCDPLAMIIDRASACEAPKTPSES
ncbi:MAG: DNA-binding protein [Desulfurococcaceae archaeon]